jgi:hypothetical protein
MSKRPLTANQGSDSSKRRRSAAESEDEIEPMDNDFEPVATAPLRISTQASGLALFGP